MGTRGAIGFIMNEEEKITYNHWDSYPEALGNGILNFLNTTNIEDLGEKVKNIQMINEDSKPSPHQIQRCINNLTINLEVGDQSQEDWYCLLREAQGDLNKYCQVGMMIDNKEFLEESLFCEWAYIVNLDTKKLEVYKGFNKNKGGKGRYANLQSEPYSKYYGVVLLFELDLYDLPDKFEEEYNEDTEQSILHLKYNEEWKNKTIDLDK